MIDPLSQHLELLRIRRRAARRNGWFFLVLTMISATLAVLYLRSQYEFELELLPFFFIFILFGSLLLMHATAESIYASIIDLVEAMRATGK